MEKEALRSHKLANEIKDNGKEIDENKQEYLRSITPPKEGEKELFSRFFNHTIPSKRTTCMHIMHYYQVYYSKGNQCEKGI